MILTSLTGVTTTDFTEQTGWQAQQAGLCLGDVCVPAPGSLRADDTIDVEVAAAALGMPIVVGDGMWALGPATVGGRALASATAADPELQTRDGDPFRLSSLHGRKVLLVAWASY